MIKKHFPLLVICVGSIIVSACQTAAPVQPTPDDSSTITATITAKLKNEAQIKLSDHERTFLYHLTDRFSVFLDDTKYPVKDLTCTPGDIIDYTSNGSMRGPDLYPITFEAVGEGKCRLKDRDFHVDIIVKP